MNGYERLTFALVFCVLIGLVVSEAEARLTSRLFPAQELVVGRRAAFDKSAWHQNHQFRLNQIRRGKRRRKRKPKMACMNEPKSVWLRNDCLGGYVTVLDDRRVVAVHEGVDRFDERVELKKETCQDPRLGMGSPIKTRLYSKSQQRYLCFNSRGRLRSVNRRRAERLGNMCAFYERLIAEPAHRHYGGHAEASVHLSLQSAYEPDWFLGFGPSRAQKNMGVRTTVEGNALMPARKMGHGHTPVKPQTKCDFRFTTGPVQESNSWTGLIKHIKANKELRRAPSRSHKYQNLRELRRRIWRENSSGPRPSDPLSADPRISRNFGEYSP